MVCCFVLFSHNLNSKHIFLIINFGDDKRKSRIPQVDDDWSGACHYRPPGRNPMEQRINGASSTRSTPLHSTLCNLSSQQPNGFRPTPLSFSPEDSVTQWSDLGLIKFMGPADVRNFHRSHSSAPF